MSCPYFIDGRCEQATQLADGLEVRPTESACRVCQSEVPPMNINKVTVSLAVSTLARHDQEKMNHIVAAYQHLLSANPSVRQKATRYTLAVTQWIKSGRPRRTSEHIRYLLQNVCKPCLHYRSRDSSCGLCGCRVSDSSLPLANKLAMATESCPVGRFRALMDFSRVHAFLLTTTPGLEGWVYHGVRQHCAAVTSVRALQPSQLINPSPIPSETICNFRNMQRLCEEAIMSGHEYVLLADTRLPEGVTNFDAICQVVREAPADWECLILAYSSAVGEIQVASDITYLAPTYVRCPMLWVSHLKVIKQFYSSMIPYRWDFGISQLVPRPQVYTISPPLIRLP